MYNSQLIGDKIWAHQRSENDRENWVFRDRQLLTYLKNCPKNTDVYERISDIEPTSVANIATAVAPQAPAPSASATL